MSEPSTNPSPVLTTDPHGEHVLTHLEPPHGLPLSSRLFVLKDSLGRQLDFTGEELTSLATQWLRYTDSH